jgi:pSer/pThr/pTyr-binding forkhead associated (FHA) protein
MSVVGYLRDVSEPENYFEVYAGRVTVGRADSNDIKIASRSVSSNHAEIEIEPSARPPKMLVTDLGSRNATFVNDVRLLGSSRAISWNDAIRFGYDTVTYRLVQELEEQQGSPRRKEDKVPPHERPPAGMPSVAEGQMNRTAMSSMSPQRGMKKTSKNTFSELAVDDGGHRGRSADDALGSPPRGRVADYDGIGFPRDEKGSDRDERGGGRGAHKPDERDRDSRDGREKDFGRARDRDGELEREEPRRSGRDPYQDRGGDDRSDDKGAARRGRGGPRETAKSDPEYEDEYAGERRSGSGIGRGRVGGEGDARHEAGELEGRSDASRRRGGGGGGGGGGGLPAPDIPGGDINYLLQEEERRLAEELNKRRADLGPLVTRIKKMC